MERRIGRGGYDTLREAWEASAQAFTAWVRKPGHDSYPRFHRDQFLPFLPPAGHRTLDLGCGEGRLARDLKHLGHDVVGIDASPTMIELAREADPALEFHVGNAASLPFDDAAFDLVVAFMSLQDIDDMPAAVREAGRVLQAGGRLCLAIVHPLNSAGMFVGDDEDSPFVISGSYLRSFRYADRLERDGLALAFHSEHRPLEAYFRALERAELLVEALREPPVPDDVIASARGRRWQRVPLFLHVRAVRAPAT